MGSERVENAEKSGACGTTVVFYSLENHCARLVRWVHKQAHMRVSRVQTPSESSYKRSELLLYAIIQLSIGTFWHVPDSIPCAVTGALLHGLHCWDSRKAGL